MDQYYSTRTHSSIRGQMQYYSTRTYIVIYEDTCSSILVRGHMYSSTRGHMHVAVLQYEDTYSSIRGHMHVAVLQYEDTYSSIRGQMQYYGHIYSNIRAHLQQYYSTRTHIQQCTRTRVVVFQRLAHGPRQPFRQPFRQPLRQPFTYSRVPATCVYVVGYIVVARTHVVLKRGAWT